MMEALGAWAEADLGTRVDVCCACRDLGRVLRMQRRVDDAEGPGVTVVGGHKSEHLPPHPHVSSRCLNTCPLRLTFHA